MLHVGKVDAVLLVLHEVEVACEYGGLLRVVGDVLCKFSKVLILALYWFPPDWR